MKKYILIYSVLLLFVFTISCKGQKKKGLPKDSISQVESYLPDSLSNNIASKAITSSYGPSRITRTIMQDSKGVIYLASYEGVIKYDGNTFTNFTEKEGLANCNAWSVLEDEDGNLWIATDGAGAYRYDGKSFTNFTTKEGLGHNRILYLYEDKTANIWFATMGGLSRYDGESFTNFTTEDGLPHNDVNWIIEDKTGKFWIGSRGDACVYDGKSFTKLTNKEGVPFNGIVSIIEDEKGNIWLGGKDGLWCYNGSTFKNFSMDGISCVYEDEKGNIWTSNRVDDLHKFALSYYDKKALLNERATATKIRVGKGMFFRILEDKEGNIWVGTLEGVFRYDGKSFNHFKDTATKE